MAISRASLMAQLVKNLPANAEDARDARLIPESGRSPGDGNGNPFQLPGKFHGERSLVGYSHGLQSMGLQTVGRNHI